MIKFVKGQAVKFYISSSIQSDNSVISAVMENVSEISVNQQYIVEFNNGWKPTQQLVDKYLLDGNQKYAFALENQVTAI